MDREPLISIITITYNAGQTIKTTLDSIARQTCRDFEHIIVDGASNDDTIAIARSSEEARIISEKDNGLYDAMNKGLVMARGRYVLFLNSGDTFHSDDTLATYAKRAREGDHIIYADTVIVDCNRHIIAKRHLTAPLKLTFDSFSRGMLVCHQAFMVRRDLAPLYDTSYKFSADYDWTVKCIANADSDKCTNLSIIAIDYLSDGLTDKNKLASLKERYLIMSRHYGKVRTFFNHLGFIVRAIKRHL